MNTEAVDTAIQPAPDMLFDVQGAKEKIDQWEKAKSALLTGPKDRVKIGNGVHVTRKGWDKIALAANVAFEVVESKTEKEGDWTPKNTEGDFTATVVERARVSWGRYQDGVGAYSASEFVSKEGTRLPITRHSVIARASTRAHNRAIADLVGGGEVSAEEINFEAQAALPEGPKPVRTLEEIQYAVKEFREFVEVKDDVSRYTVVIKANLSKEEFQTLSDSLKGLGAKYIAAKDGGPGFLIEK